MLSACPFSPHFVQGEGKTRNTGAWGLCPFETINVYEVWYNLPLTQFYLPFAPYG